MILNSRVFTIRQDSFCANSSEEVLTIAYALKAIEDVSMTEFLLIGKDSNAQKSMLQFSNKNLVWAGQINVNYSDQSKVWAFNTHESVETTVFVT